MKVVFPVLYLLTVVFLQGTPASVCRAKADVVFLLDSSLSLGATNFNLCKTFVADVIKSFAIGVHDIQVGLAVFSDHPHLQFHLNAYTNIDDILSAISSTPYYGRTTFTHAAIKMMREEMYLPRNGDRSDAPNIAILVWDGVSNLPLKTIQEADKSRTTKIIPYIMGVGVGIGVISLEMAEVANKPTAEWVTLAKTFGNLAGIKDRVVQQACKVTTAPVCRAKADVVFLLDSSRSMGYSNFKLCKKLAAEVINSFAISAYEIQVGLVSFSDDAYLEFHLNSYSTIHDIQAAVRKIPYYGRGTSTHSAIKMMRQTMFLPQNGDRSDAPNIAILLTDGISSYPVQTILEADKTRSMKIVTHIMAIGVGLGIIPLELSQVADKPTSKWVTLVKKVDDLFETKSRIAQLLACKDVNECENNNGGCDHKCINTDGSFKCECNTGYIMENNTCVIDQPCQRLSHGCQHFCVSMGSSYVCLCKPGYQLVGGKKCIDIDECLNNNGGCHHVCVNIAGSSHCKCRPGYNLVNDTECEDNNECLIQNGGCDHVCVNSVGSVKCKCRQGYKLVNGKKCEDLDECVMKNGGCEGQCVNTDGSYVCKCGAGYRLLNGSKCEDVDECKLNNGGCQHVCLNSAGSYVCTCRPGYKLQSDGTCLDINECVIKNGGCQQNCTNLPGSHTCSCFEGFVSDGTNSCKGIRSCRKDNGGCQHICNETNGAATCSCHHGYKKTNDTGCEDINECLVKYNGFCNHECVNLPGTYECRCNKGYRMVAGVCRGLCNRDDLDPPRNGIRTCTGLSDDDVCQITCQKGYDYGGIKDHALYKCNQRTDFKWKVGLLGGRYTSLTVANCIVNINAIITLIAKGELQTTETDEVKIKKALIDSMIKFSICVHPCHVPMNEIHLSRGPRYKRSLMTTYTITIKLESMVLPGVDVATVAKNLREKVEKFQALLLIGDFFIHLNGKALYLSAVPAFTIPNVSTECPPNHVQTGNKCHSCSSGYLFNSTSQTCQPCGRGYYQSLDGQSHCDQCPGNLTTFSIGARNVSSCRACPEGFDQAHNDAANDIFCFHKSRLPMTFNEANTYCRDRDSKIFAPTSKSDVAILVKTLMSLQDVWIDGTSLSSGQFKEWNQASIDVTRNCLRLQQSNYGFAWTADDCTMRLNTICERGRSE